MVTGGVTAGAVAVSLALFGCKAAGTGEGAGATLRDTPLGGSLAGDGLTVALAIRGGACGAGVESAWRGDGGVAAGVVATGAGGVAGGVEGSAEVLDSPPRSPRRFAVFVGLVLRNTRIPTARADGAHERRRHIVFPVSTD